MNEIEVIAEIGVNHDGSMSRARELIYAAAEAGADTIKFQLFDAEKVYPPERWDEMRRLELSRDQIIDLREIVLSLGLQFLCTPDTVDDARFLKEIGCGRLKIGSSNLTNVPMLREVRKLGFSDVILSTGASTEVEIEKSAAILHPIPNRTLLHCVSAYPAPLGQMNLLFIESLRGWGDVGLSDHTEGTTAALIALGLGARIFEKHLTYDKAAAGPDHVASAMPKEFADYVAVLRAGADALGDGIKRVMPCELQNRLEYDAFVRRQTEGANVDGAAP